MRRSGVLLPIASLPSAYGIGTFSKEAYEFVDFLAQAGQKLWQILPLGPTGYGDSPYQSFSTFAGNPYYIDLEALIQEGFLTEKECRAADLQDTAAYVNYEKQYKNRYPLLRKAYETAFSRYSFGEKKEYLAFKKENAGWLADYALFMAVKDAHKGACFMEWEEDIRIRKPEAVKKYAKKYEKDVEFYSFLQFLFLTQWETLKAYANEKGIEIVGDIPIYVAFDSADTWSNRELFQLDEEGYPTAVAGCPPDAFSATGQLWGNPLYDWEYHKKTGFDWWMKRLAHSFALYDVVRIDHFRGFDAYWSVPYGDKTAENGKWCDGPGYELFATMKKTLGEKQVIAEDLGFLTKRVKRLVKRTGYPGMKILQFAFDADNDSEYLPHHYNNNCVVYTGTHDNDTTLGWYCTLHRKDKKFADAYLQTGRSKKEVQWAFIRAAIASVADTAIIPMQDYLGLGSEARINTPSTLGENWQWRMEKGADSTLAERMQELNKLYAR